VLSAVKKYSTVPRLSTGWRAGLCCVVRVHEKESVLRVDRIRGVSGVGFSGVTSKDPSTSTRVILFVGPFESRRLLVNTIDQQNSR
jgi:hypothetical protein